MLNPRHVVRYTERSYSHSYRYDRFEPPLRVIMALVSRWTTGDKFEHAVRKTFSLNLVTAGNAHWVQGGSEGVAGPGEVFFAHTGQGQLFETGPAGYLHKRSLLLEGPELGSLLGSTGLLEQNTVRPFSKGRVVGLFRRCYGTMREKPEGFAVELSRNTYEILLECARSISPEYPPELRQAIRYIRRNLSRKLTLDEIARVAGLSVRHCNRLFNTHLAMSPIQFAISQRMALAENMLLATTSSIKQIAARLGYEDPLRFSLQFKQHFGKSPKHYREE